MNVLNHIDPSAGAPRFAPHRPSGNLDRQISAAETAVVERDLRIQRRAREVARRLTDHWPVTLGLTLLGSFLLGRALAPRHRPAGLPPHRELPPPQPPLWQVLSLLWPLMPERIRTRLPSGTVALLSNIGAALFGGLKPKR